MELESRRMNLSRSERTWLPWFGKTGKIAMGWACFFNRNHYKQVEKTFEGIAATRIRLLSTWAKSRWEQMESLADMAADLFPNVPQALLAEKRLSVPDLSEIFVINVEGETLSSTCSDRIGKRDLSPKAVAEGLERPFLHGPYEDRTTLAIGPSTSKFHDAVTLMFYQPIFRDDRVVGCVCGRVPNDVLGDLIQREAGHIYRESGDNYLFMVHSRFDPTLSQGTALSRSRFEDHTFSLGDNLKQGVRTEWGTVRVTNHTELELRFIDPATGDLHPGVRETIMKGENLFVTYPGYSDYRHIPVIGKGVTFQLPGSLDTWGMMCEGDLEEVYRRRSINFSLTRLYIAQVLLLIGMYPLLRNVAKFSEPVSVITTGILALLSCGAFYAIGANRLSKRIAKMTDVIQNIAEGGGNLRQRLEPGTLGNDETGDLARWTNSFIDNLDGIVSQVISSAQNVRNTNGAMIERSQATLRTSVEMMEAVHRMLDALEKQIKEIRSASTTADGMRQAMDQAVAATRTQFQNVHAKTEEIRHTMEASARSMQNLNTRTEDIGKAVKVINEIAAQTNLLALNAAIEAARAGEQGRGFAVVADAVRNLADKTTQATADIRKMIENMQSEAKDAAIVMRTSMQGVEEGLKLAEETASDNGEIHEIVGYLIETIRSMAKNAQEQSEGAQKVQIVTRDMNVSMQTLQNSTDQVQVTANQLQALVGEFQVSQRA